MKYAKVAISMQAPLLRRLDRVVKAGAFSNRSQAVTAAVAEKLQRLDKSRLARECAKLNKREEKTIANLGLASELDQWPGY